MSASVLIAYEYPLPLIDMRTMKTKVSLYIEISLLSGFMVDSRSYPHGCFGDGTDEADTYIKKEYIYDISLEADESCVALLQQYLTDNMKNESEIEIWNIWLGGGAKEYYKTKIPIKNVTFDEMDGIEDEIDWYRENIPAVPLYKKISIQDLTKNEISFVLENWYACLSISKN